MYESAAAEVQFVIDCTKHASAGALIHRQQRIYWIFAHIKLSSIYGRKAIGPWWNIKRCLQLNSGETLTSKILLLFVRDKLYGEILASVRQEEGNFEVLKRCYIQTYNWFFAV